MNHEEVKVDFPYTGESTGRQYVKGTEVKLMNNGRDNENDITNDNFKASYKGSAI